MSDGPESPNQSLIVTWRVINAKRHYQSGNLDQICAMRRRLGVRFNWWLRNLSISNVKVRDVIKLLARDGWRHIRTKGSHRQFQHSVKAGTVTVAGSPGTDVPPGTLNSILKSAGLKKS